MRNIIITLTFLAICGCTGLRQGPKADKISGHQIVTKPGDTLAAVAEQRYGAPDYAGLIAYYNELSADSLAAGMTLDLPTIDKMVSSLSTLTAHIAPVNAIIRGGTSFAGVLPDLRAQRAEVALGVDKAVPAELRSELIRAADQFKRAAKMLDKLREADEAYPERLQTALEMAAEEIRVHATGRYYRRHVSVRQTQEQVARIFAELLTWHKVLSGDLSRETLIFPRARCG